MTDENQNFTVFFNPSGNNRWINPNEIEQPQANNEIAWFHFSDNTPQTLAILTDKIGVDKLAIEALLADETRPRFTPFDEGTLIILRAVNLNPGDAPEDMISLRLWVESTRVISVCRQPILAVTDLRQQLEKKHHLQTVGDLVTALIARMTDRIRQAVTDMDDTLDQLEGEVLENVAFDMRDKLLVLHRETIWLKRFLVPQLDALQALLETPPIWCQAPQQLRIRESENVTQRMLESLNAIRDHVALLQDRLASALAEKTHRTIYIFTLIAAIFLPLNLIAALLGVNIGGIPGADHPWAFLILCGVVIVIAGVEIALLKWLKWL